MEEDVRCKNIHVKLDRVTHTQFKAGLVIHGVSMQEAFEEFAKRFAAGERSAVRLIERMVRERVKSELSGTGLKPGLRRRRILNELDHDTLYDLINEGEQDTDEAPLPPEG